MIHERVRAAGVWEMWFIDKYGVEKWRERFENVVVTVGKNLALDTYLAGSSYTVTGPFVFIVTTTGFTAFASGDTMTSHAGWTESSAYSTRGSVSWAAASGGSKSFASASAISITGNDTLQGGGLVYGSGASSTAGNTGGTLYSAGSFTGGTQGVTTGGTLNCTYQTSL